MTTNAERGLLRWHFDKRISVDTIIAIVVIGGALLVAWRTMETRVLTLETKWEEQSKASAVAAAADRDVRDRNERRLDKISDDVQRIQLSVARMEVTLIGSGSKK
jgi:hydrogenase maturation factor HypF (carbamoyltransferase family)